MMSDGVSQIENISRAAQSFLCRTIISQMLISKGIVDTGHSILQAGMPVPPSTIQHPVSSTQNLASSIQNPVSSIQYPASSIEYPEPSIQRIRDEIAGMDLGGFPFEVLSDIYESYLTRKLVVNPIGELEYLQESRRRKGKGIYYTPRYIVRYMVDRTLGKYLWGTESGRPEGNTPAKTPEDIRDLRILDPACGSGSFLAYAFDVLAEFYAQYSSHNGTDWLPVILGNHLYGIDLDSDAVDVTSAILRAKSIELRTLASGEQRAKSPMPYDLRSNIRRGNFLISNPSAAQDLMPFNWETEAPEVLRGGGFTMILGNPPYGAQLTKAERKLIRLDYETHRSSDSSSLFVEKAVKMLSDDGFLSFIVPKSLSYVVSWYPIREFLLNECRIAEIADARKAFKGVLLEQMVIIAQKRSRKQGTRYETLGARHKTQGSLESRVLSPESSLRTTVSLLRPEYSTVSHSIDSSALSAERFSMWTSSQRIKDIADRIWEKSIPLGHVAEIWSGLNTRCWMLDTGCLTSQNPVSRIQYPVSSIQNPVRPCLRGKDIQRYHIRQAIQYIRVTDVLKRQRQSLETFCRSKIIAQDIVAYIKNPRPHIKLMTTIDRSGSWLNVNTVTNIASSEYGLEYLCGILNSRLISWYAYDFIYNRAIRTMHFRRGYADHIPVRCIDPGDLCCKLMHDQLVEYVNRIIALYDEGASTCACPEITKLDTKIDELIYKLYGLTDEDVRFLREHAGLY